MGTWCTDLCRLIGTKSTYLWGLDVLTYADLWGLDVLTYADLWGVDVLTFADL